MRNHIKIALRNLSMHKGFSAITIFGLATGMSVCLLMILFIRYQTSFDQFHDKADRIYHLYSDYKAAINSTSHLYGTTPVDLGRALRDEVPGVENFITLKRFGGKVSGKGEKLEMNGFYATDAFFDMLDFEFIAGDPTTALADPFALVLTESTAQRLLGDSEAVGQTLEVAGQGVFKITGVVRDLKTPSVFEFETIISFATIFSSETERQMLNEWDKTVRSYYTFVLLRDGYPADELQAQFPQVISTHFPGTDESHLVALHAQKLTSISTGPFMDNAMRFLLPVQMLYIMSAIAAVILFAACFNFVSLAVARALGRAREVGVRKVIGARRGQLIVQFIVESVFMTVIALLVAAAIMGWLVDGFNSLTPVQFTKSQINVDYADWSLYVSFALFAIAVGLLAGLYPAVYLSRFQPTVVLKGKALVRSKGFLLRKGLIVTQFALSLVFIISTLLLFQQSQHISKTDYGFDQKNVLNVQLQDVPYDIFRAKMVTVSGVEDVSAASRLTGEGSRQDTWMQSENLPEKLKGYTVWADENYLETFKIPLVAGRNFDEFREASENFVLLNEAAVSRLQLGAPIDAIGKIVILHEDEPVEIIGVVPDYRFYSALTEVHPLALRQSNGEYRVASIRFRGDDYGKIVTALQASWPDMSKEPLDYALFEDQLAEALEVKLLRDFLHIIALAAAFAIIIAGLGLLGITIFMTETRLKEVSIHKVLGATSLDAVRLLSGSFVRMIAIAVIIAAPLAWFINNLWLEQLGNRIEMGPEVFALGILFLAAIAFAVIGSQTIRAARTNPTEILQYE